MKRTPGRIARADVGYDAVLADVVVLIQDARRAASRSVNAVMTTAYWHVGRRLVEQEQGGARRAAYGEEVLSRLAADLTARFGRGFSVDRLETARLFYLAYPDRLISATPSRKSLAPISVTASRSSAAAASTGGFQLAWSHYVLLLRRVASDVARAFYEAESLRGGWTVRQLERQIASQFYERTALSRNKASMLRKGSVTKRSDATTPEEEIKDPLVLEFLGLKDEYSESDLEDALIAKLEAFLLEMGGDFAFVGRQRRLRIGSQWFRVDLIFFHRRLRCLVVVDLKLGHFTHADAGQMHLYLNYAREHWTVPGENPPVGLILCASKEDSVVRYALEGLPNKVLAAEYRTTLPDERVIAKALVETRRQIEARQSSSSSPRRR
jgi:predicted nuclease of restriction endonuclease-like (RecB) superfamily